MTHQKGLQIFTGFTVACKSYILSAYMRFQFPDFDNTSSFANYVAKKISYQYPRIHFHHISIVPFLFPANYFPNLPPFEFRKKRGSRNETSTRATLAVRNVAADLFGKKEKGNGRKREGEAERGMGSAAGGNNILTLNAATGANFQML